MLNRLLPEGFENPNLLLLVPAVWLGVALLALRARGELAPAVRVAVRVLRALCLSLLVFTLAAPYGVRRELDPLRWIVVRDVSASISRDRTEAWRHLGARLRGLESGAEWVEIRFAGGAVGAPGELDPPAHASDIREALQHARAAIRPARRNRIVLLTDGRFSRHLLAADWPPLGPVTAAVYRPPAAPAANPDPRARALGLPPRIDADAPFQVEARFVSDGAVDGRVRVDGPTPEPLVRPLHFAGPGDRTLSFPLGPLAPGHYPLRVALEAAADREPRNNLLEATLTVGPRPRVLVVDDPERDGGALRTALEVQGFSVQVAPTVPAVEGLGVLRAVVLRNRRASLSAAEARALRAFVERSGGGLVVLGGPLGGGLRRYAETPIGELLPLVPFEPPAPPPVEPGPRPAAPPPEPPAPGERPKVFESEGPASTVTLLLLIDKSGSMGERSQPGGIPAIQFAKEAAIATAETLAGGDRLGILAYDHREPPVVVWPLGPLGELRAVAGRVARLEAGGGTAFLPVLEMAHNLLRDDPSRIKHVILLTDGQRLEGERYQDAMFQTLIHRMTDGKITVSTVGVGEQVDAEFLANLAVWGQGRFYYELSPRGITKVFTLEADRVLARAGRRGQPGEDLPPGAVPPDLKPEPGESVEPAERPAPGREEPRETTAPAPAPRRLEVRLARPHPILSGVPLPVPPLAGLDPTRARPTAWVALETVEEAEPVLATGPFGAGQVLVLAADLAGGWSAEWLEWAGFGVLLAQALRHVGMPPAPEEPLARDGRVHGEELDITGDDAFGLERLDRLTGAAVLADVAPGRWAGEPERSRREPWPPVALLAALLLLAAEILLRRMAR